MSKKNFSGRPLPCGDFLRLSGGGKEIIRQSRTGSLGAILSGDLSRRLYVQKGDETPRGTAALPQPQSAESGSARYGTQPIRNDQSG